MVSRGVYCPIMEEDNSTGTFALDCRFNADALHTMTDAGNATDKRRARAGFDSLRRIREQDPEILRQLEVYVDGGARRGTDILMALALGAKGVGFGRPFLHAQAAYGEKGAIRAVRSELWCLGNRTMT